MVPELTTSVCYSFPIYYDLRLFSPPSPVTINTSGFLPLEGSPNFLEILFLIGSVGNINFIYLHSLD